MKLKIKEIFIRVALLCVIAAMLVSAVSCGVEDVKEDSTAETEPTTIEVPVFAEDVAFGQKITSNKVTTKVISVDAVSDTMVTKVDEVVGKYASIPLYKGDFAYKGKLVNRRPTDSVNEDTVEKSKNKYIDASIFIEPNSGKDVYAAIQKLVDEHKYRTIYFPDGEYLISEPIKTSAAAMNSTSFYLSDNAVIKASDDWKGGNDALIKLGGAEAKNDISTPGSNYHFIGGILDGNGVARGISLDSGRESLVSKVKIINCTVGIYIPSGVNSESSDMDLEDIDIIGFGDKSKGIVAIGCDNNFVDIRISNVRTGVETSNGNFFRGVSVKFDTSNADKMQYDGTVAFSTTGMNWYHSCSSENMQTAFWIRNDSQTVIKDFSIRWTAALGNQIAFDAPNNFNAGCSTGIIDFFDGTTENYILKVEGNVTGFLTDVIADTELCCEEDYKKAIVAQTSGEREETE